MSSHSNGVSAPTPHSTGLLTRILSIFPTLRPILSYSHRSDIINLAHTCRTLNAIIPNTVAPLRKPFRSCTVRLRACELCGATVCAGCQKVIREPESPPAAMSRLHIHRAIFMHMASHEYEARLKMQNILTYMELQPCCGGRWVSVLQRAAVKITCAWCFAKHTQHHIRNRVPRVPRVFRVPTLDWSEVPQTHTTCACTDSNKAQCEGDKRLVDIGDVAVESQLVALVALPREQISCLTDLSSCALYILDDLAGVPGSFSAV